MSGVFLSYARFDSELGERIVAGLRALDVECWWDRDMPGVDWPREIERQIDAMSALVVIWTAASKDSKYVRAEAIPAFDREKLVNIMFGVKEPPLPFNLYNGFQLDGWSGREPHDGWSRLVRTLEAKLVKTGEVKQGQLVTALGRREQGVRRRQTALTAAEEAFAAAKAADGEADAELAKARAALTRAEEQLSQVSAMHAGPNVIRGAQADLDEARTGVKDAETARRTAAGELADASRALARAKTAVETAFVSPPELAEEPAPDGAAAEAEPDIDFFAAPKPASGAARPAAAPAPNATTRPAPASGAAAGATAIGAASAAAAGPSSAATAPAAAAVGAGHAAASGSSPGIAAGAGAPPAKRSSPLPLILGGVAVLVVGVLGIALFSGHHKTATATTDNSNVMVATPANVADNAMNSAVADNTAPALAPADPVLTAAHAMEGDWGGNGAVCGSNPLTIAVDPAARTVRMTLSNTPSVGSLVGLRSSDGALQLSFSSDGHTEYDVVSGDTLTLGFNSGSMTYQRCKT
jgi:hypothetical protein